MNSQQLHDVLTHLIKYIGCHLRESEVSGVEEARMKYRDSVLEQIQGLLQ